MKTGKVPGIFGFVRLPGHPVVEIRPGFGTAAAPNSVPETTSRAVYLSSMAPVDDSFMTMPSRRVESSCRSSNDGPMVCEGQE
jgi:hypothetical protein